MGILRGKSKQVDLKINAIPGPAEAGGPGGHVPPPPPPPTFWHRKKKKKKKGRRRRKKGKESVHPVPDRDVYIHVCIKKNKPIKLY